MGKKRKQPGKPVENTASPTPVPRRVEIVPNDAVPTIYANSANIEVSTWDIKIRLGQIQSATAEVVTVKDLFWVYMSPDHAKAFSDSLAKVLQNVERVKLQAKTSDSVAH